MIIGIDIFNYYCYRPEIPRFTEPKFCVPRLIQFSFIHVTAAVASVISRTINLHLNIFLCDFLAPLFSSLYLQEHKGGGI